MLETLASPAAGLVILLCVALLAGRAARREPSPTLFQKQPPPTRSHPGPPLIKPRAERISVD